MTSENSFNFPYSSSTPPPLPVQPQRSSHNHPTVIVIVFISVGGVFFLTFLAAALFCFLNKRKKRSAQETEIVHFDEHKKIKEAAVEGPHGTQSVVLSVEDDIHIDQEMKKNDKVEDGLHAKSSLASQQQHLQHKAILEMKKNDKVEDGLHAKSSLHSQQQHLEHMG